MKKAKDGRNIGKRANNKGTGRKPLADKAINVSIYVKQSVIDDLGGKPAVKTIMKNAIENADYNTSKVIDLSWTKETGDGNPFTSQPFNPPL